MAQILQLFGSLAIAIALALCAVSLPAMANLAETRPDSEDRTSRIEAGLPAVTQGERTLHLSMSQWMQALAVPGLSIAVIDDYRTAGEGRPAKGGDAVQQADAQP